MTQIRVGALRCLLAAVLFGASTPAVSTLASEMPMLILAGLLYIGAGLSMLPAVLRSPPTAAALRCEWRQALTAVIAGGAVGPALLVAGLVNTPAATASIMLNLELAATVVLAVMVFHEHIGGRVTVGTLLVTVAGMILVWQPGAEFSVGAALVAAACAAWGIDNGVTAKIGRLHPKHVVLLKGVVAGSGNLTLGFIFNEDGIAVDVGDVIAALAIGAAGYGASIVLWVKGAHDLGAARGQVIFATAPFIGALIAWTVLGESVTPTQLAAVLLAAIGVRVSLESAHIHEHNHEDIDHAHEHSHNDDHHDHRHNSHNHEASHNGRSDEKRHAHTHQHCRIKHSHGHVPDLHHHHRHS